MWQDRQQNSLSNHHAAVLDFHSLRPCHYHHHSRGLVSQYFRSSVSNTFVSFASSAKERTRGDPFLSVVLSLCIHPAHVRLRPVLYYDHSDRWWQDSYSGLLHYHVLSNHLSDVSNPLLNRLSPPYKYEESLSS